MADRPGRRDPCVLVARRGRDRRAGPAGRGRPRGVRRGDRHQAPQAGPGGGGSDRGRGADARVRVDAGPDASRAPGSGGRPGCRRPERPLRPHRRGPGGAAGRSQPRGSLPRRGPAAVVPARVACGGAAHLKRRRRPSRAPGGPHRCRPGGAGRHRPRQALRPPGRLGSRAGGDQRRRPAGRTDPRKRGGRGQPEHLRRRPGARRSARAAGRRRHSRHRVGPGARRPGRQGRRTGGALMGRRGRAPARHGGRR